MRSKIFTSLLLACALLGFEKGTAADSFETGEEQFKAGKFEDAARSFQTVLDASGPSAGLYYDLGLANKNAGKKVDAVLAFRRALMLEPRMLTAGQSLAELQSTMGVSAPAQDWRGHLAATLPLKPLLFGSVLLGWIGAFGALVAFAGKRNILGIAMLAAFFAGALGTAAAWLADPRVSEANLGVVIADKEITLRATPADKSDLVSRALPGTSLRILSQRGVWTYAETLEGQKGWILSSQVASVVPGHEA